MKQIFLSLLVFGLIFDNFDLNPDSILLKIEERTRKNTTF